MTGKVGLVTGGASGIGRAAVLAFAREGARLLVADVDHGGAEQTAQEARALGADAASVGLDVREEAEVERAVGVATQAFGRLDFALNSAGIQGPLRETAEYAEHDWQQVLAVNLTGVWLCTKHEIRAMLRTGGGSVVNVASNFGLVGGVGMAAYSASKHGVIGLTKTAAVEYADRGVRVNALCPGATETPLVGKIIDADPVAGPEIISQITAALPMGRMGRPEEIASAALWLCSPGASFMTGAALSVDGGFVAR